MHPLQSIGNLLQFFPPVPGFVSTEEIWSVKAPIRQQIRRSFLCMGHSLSIFIAYIISLWEYHLQPNGTDEPNESMCEFWLRAASINEEQQKMCAGTSQTSSPLLSTTAPVSSEDLHPGLLPRISSLSWSCCQARTLMLPAHRTSHKPITSTIILSSRGRQRQTIEKKRFGGEIDREEGQMTEERWVKRWLRTRGGCGLSHAVIQTKDSYEKIYSWKRDVSNKRQLVMPSTIDAVIY